jgi:transcriptional regulator with XRE-family HTH domain
VLANKVFNIGRRINELRQKRGLTQSQLGDKLEVSYIAIQNWERGETDFRISTLLKIAAALNYPPSEFFEKPSNTPIKRGRPPKKKASRKYSSLGR